MSRHVLPSTREISQGWNADFDDWDGDGRVDYPGGFYRTIGWLGHNGIDQRCPVGDPVRASADGVVEFAGDGNRHPWLTGGGNAVLIQHGDVRSEYLHLSRIAVGRGQAVTQGQVIAYAGKTGTVTAAHLHWGLLPGGAVNIHNGYRGRICPWPYMEENMSMTTDQNNALGAVFSHLNLAPAAGLIASQGDISMVLSALAGVTARLDAMAGKSEGTQLVRSVEDATVYIHDAGTGYRALGYDEFAALMASGASLGYMDQATLQAALEDQREREAAEAAK